jgi:poly(hydroxyalkanoate) depolymerase family esterase
MILTKSLRILVPSLVLALSVLASTSASAGHWTFGVYGNIWGVREFQTWIPDGYEEGTPVPMVLVLHGCLTEPNSMAAVSRFNELADQEKFIVVYPRQNVTSNPERCWNFMLSFNQSRDTGEPAILKGIVDRVKSEYSIDDSRVYVTGISAGGAMTSVMAACYSDVFAAASVHAGAMYKVGIGLVTSAVSMLLGSPFDPNERGRAAWNCAGAPRRLIPVLVFHGTADSVVNPVNGDQVVQQFIQTNDLGDDGLDNDTARFSPSHVAEGLTPVPDGRRFTVATFKNSAGVVVAQKYTIDGMNHAWSGGPALLPFSDELGPDSTVISWDFFKNYQR